MAQTYDPSLGSTRDWVRLLIGDNGATMTLSDEEIDGIIAEQVSTGQAVKYYAAADAVHVLYGFFKAGRGGVVDRQIGKLRLRFAEDVSAYNAITATASEFRKKGAYYLSRNSGAAYSFKVM